jgi:hypothetical protein
MNTTKRTTAKVLLAGVASVLALGLVVAPNAHADAPCHVGAVVPAPSNGRADAYNICQSGTWVHVVPYTDPNSADGYGSNQILPPLCVRFPGQFTCPS